MKTMEEKRKEAQERQAVYDKLSVNEKAEKLNAGGFRAIKQRLKLARVLTARGGQ